MNGINRVCILGNLGADPELRATSKGTSVLNMRVATNERVKRNDEWEDHTEWHNVVVWGKRAEGLGKFLTKGATVYVEGPLRTSSYEDRDGNKRYKTEINASEVVVIGGGGQSNDRPSRRDDRDDRSRREPAREERGRRSMSDPDDEEDPFAGYR